LRSVTLDELIIDDEASFAGVALYARLKKMLRQSGHRFHVPSDETAISWDRALFLNLTFWDAAESADVLCEARLPADVLTHVAWHHLAAREIARRAPGPTCPQALLFGESIASAFDLYLVGRLLTNVPDSDFVATQVAIMSEAAEQAGLTSTDFETLMHGVVADPERAFEDLRTLLFDASQALLGCRDVLQAEATLARYAAHRFESLLHHYQLSTWILSARAATVDAPDQTRLVHDLDTTLRSAPVSLDWLADAWLGDA
ncbi:MAG: hypothetical protein ABIR79_21160, partial [Candidatus Binatia bacterium]